MNNKVYRLAWHIILAGQARKFWAIMEFFNNDPERAWLAPDEEFNFLRNIRPFNLGELLIRRKKTDIPKVANYLEDRELNIIFFNDSGYPEQLKNIFDPPPVLFLRGNSGFLKNTSVSLVGSRRASPYGLTVAESLSRDLASVGITVVSGMARGIDTAAHRGAIDAGGKTVAVLGCGVDVVYPKENRKVMESIIQHGAVVSEFPPGTPPDSWHFPVRNRVISGLSKLVVVVEAAERSGALITAHVALEQGRDVMAVPGNITSKLSKGPNGLIKQGAAPVLSARDVLDELGMGMIFSQQPDKLAGGLKLTDDEKLLLRFLNYEPISMEKIVHKSGLPASQVMSALMFLEMKGLVRQMPGRLYAQSK